MIAALQTVWLVARRHKIAGSRYLVVITLAMGTAVLLIGTAFEHGMRARERRAAQRFELYTDGGKSGGTTTVSLGTRPLTVIVSAREQAAVAPAPGTALVSPALAKLLSVDPSVRARVPVPVTGELPARLLRAPDELVAIVRVEPGDATASATHGVGTRRDDAAGARTATVIATVALLAPALLLIAAAARLDARRRDRELAILLLVGATSRRAREVVVVQAVIAAVPAALLAIAAVAAIRPLLATADLSGAFFASDLTPGFGRTAVALAAAPLLAAAGSLLGVRRLSIDPLRGHRAGNVRTPRASRVVPVATGFTLLMAVTAFAEHLPEPMLAAGEAAALLLVIVGLAMAGPWAVHRLASGLLRRDFAGPPRLLALRRGQRQPHAIFRGGLGLVVVAFMFSFVSVLDLDGVSGSDDSPFGAADVEIALNGHLARDVLTDVLAIPGVRAVAPLALGASTTGPSDFSLATTCAGLPVLGITVTSGSCRTGSSLIRDDRLDRPGGPGARLASPPAATPLPGAEGRREPDPPRAASGTFATWHRFPRVAGVVAIAIEDADRHSVTRVLVTTDGRPATADSVIAATARHAPLAVAGSPAQVRGNVPEAVAVRRTLRAALAVSVLLAVVTVLIGVAEAVAERRPELTLLTAVGMPSSEARRWVVTEAVLPLVAGAVPASLIGIAAAAGAGRLLGGDVAVSWPDAIGAVVMPVVAGALGAAATSALVRPRVDPLYLRQD